MIKRGKDVQFDYVSVKTIDKNDPKYDKYIDLVTSKYDLFLSEKNEKTYIRFTSYNCLRYTETFVPHGEKETKLLLYLLYVEPGVEND